MPVIKRPHTLYCIPYAGGTASMIYSKWKKSCNDDLVIEPLELKGRGARGREDFYESIQEAALDLSSSIHENEFSLYAHSMGTLIAYELMFALAKIGKKPVHLFLSGRYAPHIKSVKNFHIANEQEFIHEIERIGGTPRVVLENRELLNLFLPILKADYRISECYQQTKSEHLFDCNIHYFFSNEDTLITLEQVKEWHTYTSGKMHIYNFNGGHFFIHEAYPEMLNIIKNITTLHA